ncbi:hypothetical protein [Teredinibacter sp. KSP-S5-2]|uniref:hypothetical protein n=1 Tax=Teredinibacter sp. KSP-S5-2 TaxID=3034506 RepID=UPI002934EAE9|nr:hypothetical protein [Teredinibacter sp. KSP-S5-2]WNO10467.1 hypothetical protein P5V12_04710 [Teredinibacter sp. KSP-S5-2]
MFATTVRDTLGRTYRIYPFGQQPFFPANLQTQIQPLHLSDPVSAEQFKHHLCVQPSFWDQFFNFYSLGATRARTPLEFDKQIVQILMSRRIMIYEIPRGKSHIAPRVERVVQNKKSKLEVEFAPSSVLLWDDSASTRVRHFFTEEDATCFLDELDLSVEEMQSFQILLGLRQTKRDYEIIVRELAKEILKGKVVVLINPLHNETQLKSSGREDSDVREKPPTLGPHAGEGGTVFNHSGSSSKTESTEPNNLADVEKILSDRRQQIIQDGYKQKYTDEELLEIAKTGEVNDRFLVRLVFGDEDKARGGTLGFRRDSGRAPYWATTLEMAEAADTDPEILSGLFGIENFDHEQPFCLAVIDMEKMPAQAERESFVPTFEKMSEFGEKEFTEKEGFGPSTMKDIMNEDFAEEYTEFMDDYKNTGQNPYDSQLIMRHAQKSSNISDKQKLIRARHKTQMEFGANPLFSGNGLTKVTPDSRYAHNIGQKYGVVETFTFERDPLTVGELEKQGAVKIIPAKPIKGK